MAGVRPRNVWVRLLSVPTRRLIVVRMVRTRLRMRIPFIVMVLNRFVLGFRVLMVLAVGAVW